MSIPKSLSSIYNPSCKRCDLHQGVRTVCVQGRGKFEDRIMFIAEAPGEQEDKAGIALVGKAGKIFDSVITSIGMSSNDIYATNIVKCRPPGNRAPTGREAEACKVYLYREITALDPRVIVLMGGSAIKFFFGKKATVRAYRGKMHDWNGYQVFCTLHPSSVNYEPYNLNLITDDMNLLVRELNGDGNNRKPTEYRYDPSSRDYPTHIGSELDGGILAIDIETSGLDQFDPDFRILSEAFCDREHTGSSFLLSHRKALTDPERMSSILKPLHKGRIIVGHNIKFDLLGLRTIGIFVDGPVRDTMVMAHLLDENNPDKSLESLALRDTDMGNIKTETKESFSAGQQEEIDPNVLMERNCRDVDATLRLHNKYLKPLEKEGMIPLLEFQMNVLKMLVDVEWEGWRIDLDNYSALRKDYKRRILEKRRAIWDYSGEINLNSTQQRAAFLFGDLKIKPLSKEEGGLTKTGELSTSKDVLKKLLWTAKGTRKKIIEDMVEYSTLVKRFSFFAQITEHLKDDCKVHPSYRQTKLEWGEENDLGGTVTGRLSCKKPNVQQIPREGDIKKIFRTKYKNGAMVQLDYSQMELRVLAELSGDKKMVQIFKDDKIDIHRRVASWPGVYNKPESEITEKERKFTKQVNFGISYMIGPQGLARKLSEVVGYIVTESESKRLIDGWFKEFVGVKAWIESTKRELIRYGEVATLMGRKRHLADTNPSTAKGREGIRQGVNFLIQSLASDITLYRAVDLWKWLRKEEMRSKIVGFVHDSVVVDSPREEVKAVVKAMRRIFEDGDFSRDFGFTMKVPLKIEVKTGPTWGELKVEEE